MPFPISSALCLDERPKSGPKEQQPTRLESSNNKFNPPQQGRRELQLGMAEREEERATLTTVQRTHNRWKTLRVLRHFPSRPVSACSRKS